MLFCDAMHNRFTLLLLGWAFVTSSPVKAADLRLGFQDDSPYLEKGGLRELEDFLGKGFRVTGLEGTSVALVTLGRGDDAAEAIAAIRKRAPRGLRFVERDWSALSDARLPDGADLVEEKTCFFCHSRVHSRARMRMASVIAKLRVMSRDRFESLFTTVDSLVMRRIGRDLTDAQREALRLYVQRLPARLPDRLPGEEISDR